MTALQMSPPSREASPANGDPAVGNPPPPPPTAGPTAKGTAAGEAFTDLRIWAESYADTQQTRIALVNRMQRGGVDASLLAGHQQLLEASENAFRLAMVRSYRRIVRGSMPAVEEWQKNSFGIGEHLLARLLGHLGHPRLAEPYEWMDEAPEGHHCIPERCGERHLVALQPFERSVRQLWAYCGHGAPVRRRKGMSQEDALGLGSPRCKMLVHLLAEATIKCQPQPTPKATASELSVGADSSDKYRYRRIYDTRKASTEGRVSPDGKPWTDGHRHADALRIVGKNILRDLWTAAQRQVDSRGQFGTAGGPS